MYQFISIETEKILSLNNLKIVAEKFFLTLNSEQVSGTLISYHFQYYFVTLDSLVTKYTS